MGTGILCKAGSDLGNTFRGYADFQLTDNIIAKTHIGHFTFWHASVVTNPKCLFLAEDIFCTNYLGGEGNRILSWDHVKDYRTDPLATMNEHDASIIAVPVPVGAISAQDHRLNLSNPISLTGQLDPVRRQAAMRSSAEFVNIGDYAYRGTTQETLNTWNEKIRARDRARLSVPEPPGMAMVTTADTPQAARGIGYSKLFSRIWGWGEMNHEVDYENSQTFETAGRVINVMCFHTMQRFKNNTTGKWEIANLNSGHFGTNGIYEGAKKIRCGFLDHFKDMAYEKAFAHNSA
jgi:hypothetical protein